MKQTKKKYVNYMVLQNCLHMKCRSITYNRIWPDWKEIRPRSIWIYQSDIMAWPLGFDGFSLGEQNDVVMQIELKNWRKKYIKNVEIEAREKGKW